MSVRLAWVLTNSEKTSTEFYPFLHRAKRYTVHRCISIWVTFFARAVGKVLRAARLAFPIYVFLISSANIAPLNSNENNSNQRRNLFLINSNYRRNNRKVKTPSKY